RRDRHGDGALRADRSALGRDPGADRPAAVRGHGRAQPAPLRRHRRDVRCRGGAAHRPGPRGVRRRRSGSGGGAGDRGAPEERPGGGARLQAPGARPCRPGPVGSATRGAGGAGGGQTRLSRGRGGPRELSGAAGSLLVRGSADMKLEGIRVVDLSLFLPGPAMTQTMADHGAEVIKVEPLPAGEPCRAIGARRDGVTVWFANTHRGKKSLTLNLKTPEGVEALLRLAETADVFVEAFRPGVVDRLGVGYRAVAARNPRIVYASISAYGQSGPYAQLPAHDLAVEAMSGVLSVNVGRDDRPWNPAIQAADMLASHIALSGVLVALWRRARTGKGDYLDIALLDALIAAMPNNYGPPMAEKRDPVPKDERSWGGNAMFRVYETKDGRFVALGGSEIKFATNLLTALGRPDLIELCRLPPGPGQQPVREFLEATFRTRT